MNDNKTVFYKNRPSAISIYEPPEPIPVDMDVDDQVEILLSKACLTDFNPDSALYTGIADPDSIVGLTMAELLCQFLNTKDRAADFTWDTARQELYTRLRQFVLAGYVLEDLSTKWVMNDENQCYNASYHGLVNNGFLTRMIIVHRDEAVRQLQEKLVSNIAQSLAAEVEESFFNHLVSRLAETLELDFAMVAEGVPDSDGKVKVLAFYDTRNKTHNQGHTDLGAEYCLKGSPGYEALQGKEVSYRSQLASHFPDDPYVAELGIDSYIAVPILGENYQSLGLISLMHGEELLNETLVRSVLNIFAIRASAEIERHRIYQERSRREQQQIIFIENSSSGMCVVDIVPPMPTALPMLQQVKWLAENSRLVECNQALANIVGYGKKSQLIGSSLVNDVITYDFATQAREFVSQGYLFRDQLISLTSVSKEEVWLSSNISSVMVDGCLTQILGMFSDVSDRVRHSREMEFRAKHDGLTGLPNRSYFIEQVELVLKLSSPASTHALFLLDLDGFKEVNDTLGHETGDYLLKQIGPRVQPVLSGSKTLLARLGGDEFAVLVEDYESQQSVTGLASLLMESIKSPFTINELELVVGGSVGIALYPENGDSVSSLMRCADIAMYQAKQQSRDYCIYSTDRDHYTVRRLSLMMDIRQAIANGELRLHYQPIVNLHTQDVVAFEGLIRWQHPEHGMLAPGEFIPLIELTDMIMPVTWWVIETAIRQLAEWSKKGWEFRISVNVSTRNLVDAGFVSFIETCLQRYQVEGRFLEMEITESSLMADPEKARRVLQSIAALGMLISVDDYGTGYSSLAYLKSLPINTLKIDRTFISQILTNSQDQIIVNSTIQLAHNLGLEVTAEGIEDGALIKVLDQLGCDKGQGYFLCRPIAVDELHVWLSLHERRAMAD